MREEEKQTSKLKGSKVRKYLRKRWVFPAVYIGAAAVIIAGALIFQNITSNNVELGEEDVNVDNIDSQQEGYGVGQEAVEVTASPETIQMPVHNDEGMYIQKNYYDVDSSEEDQEAALVFYNNTYYPNTGLDFAMESGESFDVVASLSGTVVEAERDSLIGNYVKLKHENGVTTHYSSLQDIFVEVGQTIDQGTVIGTAGSNEYNKEAGIHVHFEIRKNDEPVNPNNYFDKPFTALDDANNDKNEEVDKEEDSEKPEKEEKNTSDDENTSDDDKADDEAKSDVSYLMTRA